jgi:hypothetical protein
MFLQAVPWNTLRISAERQSRLALERPYSHSYPSTQPTLKFKLNRKDLVELVSWLMASSIRSAALQADQPRTLHNTDMQ